MKLLFRAVINVSVAFKLLYFHFRHGMNKYAVRIILSEYRVQRGTFWFVWRASHVACIILEEVTGNTETVFGAEPPGYPTTDIIPVTWNACWTTDSRYRVYKGGGGGFSGIEVVLQTIGVTALVDDQRWYLFDRQKAKLVRGLCNMSKCQTGGATIQPVVRSADNWSFIFLSCHSDCGAHLTYSLAWQPSQNLGRLTTCPLYARYFQSLTFRLQPGRGAEKYFYLWNMRSISCYVLFL